MWRSEKVESWKIVDPDVWDITAAGEDPDDWLGSWTNESRVLDVVQKCLDDES